jgi:hypothetical protein
LFSSTFSLLNLEIDLSLSWDDSTQQIKVIKAADDNVQRSFPTSNTAENHVSLPHSLKSQGMGGNSDK